MAESKWKQNRTREKTLRIPVTPEEEGRIRAIWLRHGKPGEQVGTFIRNIILELEDNPPKRPTNT